MRLTYARAAGLAASLLMGGGGLTLATAPAASGGTIASPAASRASHGHVLITCTGRRVVRPGGFVLACADGNDFLTRLHWVSWGAAAFASGTERINDCVPSCAAGSFHSYPVLTAFWHGKRLGGSRTRRYARLTVIYTGKRPPGSGPAKTLSLPG